MGDILHKVFLSILFSLFILSSAVVIAQEKCATPKFNDQLNILKNNPESVDQFENWIRQEINLKKVQRQFSVLSLNSETVYQIPVVIHVIHNGEDIGTGLNISDDQISSQMDSLNADFRRLNADRVNTPAVFSEVSADVKIEFVLAQRDPEGLPTTGVIRVTGSQTSYSDNEAELIASHSYWPAEDYLNIWVTNLSGNFIGFAKFPISNLPGMDDSPNLNRLIDGVYIDFQYFGTNLIGEFQSLGRTTTHEIGHWLGLRHIWGDGGCSLDDFCNDTPDQSGSSSGCPAEGSKITCSSTDMFQNYMDYTDDLCMNIFTLDQRERMRTVMENSPRRKSLLSSKGGQIAVQVANDLGIREINSPSFGNCSATLVPSIEVKNYGTNSITSFDVELLVDAVSIETISISQTLDIAQSTSISFSGLIAADNTNKFTFKVKKVNGGTDGNADNDCQWQSTFFASWETIPLIENFEGSVSAGADRWSIKNDQDQPAAWGFANAPADLSTNESTILNYHGVAAATFGALDYLITPVFDITQLATLDLKFKYAYSGHPTNFSDALTVIVSTDCGANFPQENILFQKIGAALTTTSAVTSSAFVPSGPDDWSTVEMNFGQFINNNNIILAFIGSNGGGNNIYVDDVEIFSSASLEYDLGITQIESMPIVTCFDEIDAVVSIRNFGKQTINSFTLSYEYGSTETSIAIVGLDLKPGKTHSHQLTLSFLDSDSYILNISVSLPNGATDENNDNNNLARFFAVDTSVELVPLREKFSENLSSSDWHAIRVDDAYDWQTVSVDRNNLDYALKHPGYDLIDLGIENWFISPLLDFTNADSASVFFDLSYANKASRSDQLRVLASFDCGENYPDVLYDRAGEELAITQSEDLWEPTTDTDWKREYINLNKYSGWKNVRIAFVVTNQNGNNLYLDNIEFFVSDEEAPLTTEAAMISYPNPASDFVRVTFNFNIKESILIRLVALNGLVVAEQTFNETLNQTYQLNNLEVDDGLYVLQVLGDNTRLSSKIMVIKK